MAVAETHITNNDISIWGTITLDGSLIFDGSYGGLNVFDTLIVNGDLYIGDHNRLDLSDEAVLIVRGSLHLNKHAEIDADGYCIVTADIYHGGPNGEGNVTSNDNPVKIFVGGNIPIGLTNDNHTIPPSTALQVQPSIILILPAATGISLISSTIPYILFFFPRARKLLQRSLPTAPLPFARGARLP